MTEEAILCDIIDYHMDSNHVTDIGHSVQQMQSSIRTLEKLLVMYRRRHSVLAKFCNNLYIEKFAEEFLLRVDAVEKYIIAVDCRCNMVCLFAGCGILVD